MPIFCRPSNARVTSAAIAVFSLVAASAPVRAQPMAARLTVGAGRGGGQPLRSTTSARGARVPVLAEAELPPRAAHAIIGAGAGAVMGYVIWGMATIFSDSPPDAAARRQRARWVVGGAVAGAAFAAFNWPGRSQGARARALGPVAP